MAQELARQVAAAAAALGISYAATLAVLERRLPIKPTWVSLEVVGGVILVALPVLRAARQAPDDAITWRDYERLVAAGFIGAGLPICLWQLVEYGLLQQR